MLSAAVLAAISKREIAMRIGSIVIHAAALAMVTHLAPAHATDGPSGFFSKKLYQPTLDNIDIGECFQAPSDCYGGATVCYGGRTYTCIYQGHGKWCVISNHC